MAGNVVAVILIPFVGNLSDRIGRRPVIIAGCLGSGILGFPYLYFVSQGNLVMAFVFAILMWGIVYQGYNAVFPSFYPELFPTKTRVTGFAMSQNIGTLITAFLPLIYAVLAPTAPKECVESKKFMPDKILPSGETCRAAADAAEGRVIMVVGGFTLAFAVIAVLAAFMRARDVQDSHERSGQEGRRARSQGRVRAVADRGKGARVEVVPLRFSSRHCLQEFP